LKVGVQIFCGPKAHIENFEKLKPLRYDFHDSDSCKRLSIYPLNRCFSFIILLSYPFLNLPCLTLNYVWDRNSSCYEKTPAQIFDSYPHKYSPTHVYPRVYIYSSRQSSLGTIWWVNITEQGLCLWNRFTQLWFIWSKQKWNSLKKC